MLTPKQNIECQYQNVERKKNKTLHVNSQFNRNNVFRVSANAIKSLKKREQKTELKELYSTLLNETT